MPESLKALWYKDFCKKKKNDSCNTNGIITFVLIWQGQKDLVSPAGSVGASALRAEVSTGDPHPSTRSACRVFKLFNPSQNKKTPVGVFLFWQGQKDLNPRHAVLETAALPTELYPYIIKLNGGPSGTRTPDQPVMSRSL